MHEESWLDPADECCHEELQPAAPLALQPNLLAPSPAAELRPAALGVDPAALAVWVLLRALQTTVVRQALTEPLGIRALFLPASPHPPQDRMPVPAQTAGLGSAAATCSECSSADRRSAPASTRCEWVLGQWAGWRELKERAVEQEKTSVRQPHHPAEDSQPRLNQHKPPGVLYRSQWMTCCVEGGVWGARHGGAAWGLVMQHCGIAAAVTRLG